MYHFKMVLWPKIDWAEVEQILVILNRGWPLNPRFITQYTKASLFIAVIFILVGITI